MIGLSARGADPPQELRLAGKRSRARPHGREAGPARARSGDRRYEDLRDLLNRGDEAPGRFEFHGDIIPLRDLERRYASWALAQTGGHRGKTAEKLGVDPKTLRKWLGDSEHEGDE